jgi:hypothetical protein
MSSHTREEVIFIQYTSLGQGVMVGKATIPSNSLTWRFPIKAEINVGYSTDVLENPPDIQYVEYKREGRKNIFVYNPFNIITLLEKKDKLGNHGYNAIFSNGRRYSIMNFGSLMESAPDILKSSGIFMGWEAMRLNLNGEMDTDNPIRANSEEELIKKITG